MFPLHEPLSDDVRQALAAYDDLIAALLARRGVSSKDAAERFLNPSYDDHLHDPLTMTDMPRAAERLARAIREGEHIATWTDYDSDGGPAAVLLHDFFEKAGVASFETYIPHRHREGYGMNIPGIEKLAAAGVTLIVTADVGITDSEPVARAKELGMDVIVTDHHLPVLDEAEGPQLPDAYAVVNPNARPDEPYPFKGLCGAGVAWKLVCATLAVAPDLRTRVPDGWEKWLLDMVGLATIADMVPLTGENRVLATYGLRVLRKSPRKGLGKLCRVMRTEQRTLTEDDVGFMIAPRVNAASRMGDARDAFTLLTTDDEDEADRLAKLLEQSNRRRKAEAGAITRAVHARLKERTALGPVLALGDPEWRPALLGLVANGIMDEHERPVFLWGREGDGSLKGSVRAPRGTHALCLMQETADIFVDFGGHAASGGFTVKDACVSELERRLAESLARCTQSKEEDAWHADGALTLDEVTLPFLTKLERLAPFGQENPKPVFLVRGVRVTEATRFGKGSEHLKLSLISEPSGRALDAVAFFAKGALAHHAEQALGGRADLLAHIERDAFSRKNPLRLRLLDIRLV